jgi:hypothetical protein
VADDSFRLDYTQRDYTTLDDEVVRYLQAHFPEINVVRDGTPGRSFVRLLQGIIDILGFSVDATAVESRLGTVQQPQNAAALAEGLAYFPEGPTPAQTDLVFTLLTGTAPSTGTPIPAGSRVIRTSPSPALEFLTLEDAQVASGQSSVTVSVAEGVQVTDEVLATTFQRTNDTPSFRLANKRVWQDSIRVFVGDEEWTYVPMSTLSLGPNYPSFRVINDLLNLETFIWFPFTGPWAGRPIPSGTQVKVNYIRHNGDAGNTPASKITRIVGSLGSTFSATNQTAASGGGDGEDAETIRSKASRYFSASQVALSEEQIEAVASSIGGVLSSKVSSVNGFYIEVHVLPVGGGTASQSVLDAVKLAITQRTIFGAEVSVLSMQQAYVLTSLDVVLSDTRVSREAIRLKVREALVRELEVSNVTPGKGFALSDISVLVENADDRIDYVDINQLTRVPRVEASTTGLPAVSEVEITSSVGYSTYVITTLNSTQYQVSKNGVIDSQNGTIGTPFTVDGGEVTFTVGVTGETFPAPYADTYTFSTSAYLGNLRIDADEYMALRQQSDLTINVYYPGETA